MVHVVFQAEVLYLCSNSVVYTEMIDSTLVPKSLTLKLLFRHVQHCKGGVFTHA